VEKSYVRNTRVERSLADAIERFSADTRFFERTRTASAWRESGRSNVQITRTTSKTEHARIDVGDRISSRPATHVHFRVSRARIGQKTKKTKQNAARLKQETTMTFAAANYKPGERVTRASERFDVRGTRTNGSRIRRSRRGEPHGFLVTKTINTSRWIVRIVST